MIKELLESLNYVGHYFAICFLRIYLGVHILNLGLSKYYGDYTLEPLLAAQINEYLRMGENPAFVEYFFVEVIRPYWKFFSLLQLYFEFAAGVLLIIGFLVRPTAILFVTYLWLFSYIQDPLMWPWIGILSATLLALGWAGAGRSVGIDFYFYKRYRGFLW